jgi:predicted RNase H-like nuclease (RuvC/YqgF family)
MQQAPWTEIGRLQIDVQELSRKINDAAKSHELHSLRSDVDRLEHSLRELSTTVDGLRNELQELRQEIHEVKYPGGIT